MKIPLATRIDYKNIISLGHDGVERIRDGILGGDLEQSGTSGKKDGHRVSNHNYSDAERTLAAMRSVGFNKQKAQYWW